jgi:hypothetical protein
MSDRTQADPWAYIDGLREDLGRAEERIAELETRLHDHEQTMPHLYADGSSA